MDAGGRELIGTWRSELGEYTVSANAQGHLAYRENVNGQIGGWLRPPQPGDPVGWWLAQVVSADQPRETLGWFRCRRERGPSGELGGLLSQVLFAGEESTGWDQVKVVQAWPVLQQGAAAHPTALPHIERDPPPQRGYRSASSVASAAPPPGAMAAPSTARPPGPPAPWPAAPAEPRRAGGGPSDGQSWTALLGDDRRRRGQPPPLAQAAPAAAAPPPGPQPLPGGLGKEHMEQLVDFLTSRPDAASFQQRKSLLRSMAAEGKPIVREGLVLVLQRDAVEVCIQQAEQRLAPGGGGGPGAPAEQQRPPPQPAASPPPPHAAPAAPAALSAQTATPAAQEVPAQDARSGWQPGTVGRPTPPAQEDGWRQGSWDGWRGSSASSSWGRSDDGWRGGGKWWEAKGERWHGPEDAAAGKWTGPDAWQQAGAASQRWEAPRAPAAAAGNGGGRPEARGSAGNACREQPAPLSGAARDAVAGCAGPTVGADKVVESLVKFMEQHPDRPKALQLCLQGGDQTGIPRPLVDVAVAKALANAMSPAQRRFQ